MSKYREQFASRIRTLRGIGEHLDPEVCFATTIHGFDGITLHLFAGIEAAAALARRLGLGTDPRGTITDDYRQVRWSGEFDGCAVTVVVCVPLGSTGGEVGV